MAETSREQREAAVRAAYDVDAGCMYMAPVWAQRWIDGEPDSSGAARMLERVASLLAARDAAALERLFAAEKRAADAVAEAHALRIAATAAGEDADIVARLLASGGQPAAAGEMSEEALLAELRKHPEFQVKEGPPYRIVYTYADGGTYTTLTRWKDKGFTHLLAEHARAATTLLADSQRITSFRVVGEPLEEEASDEFAHGVAPSVQASIAYDGHALDCPSVRAGRKEKP